MPTTVVTGSASGIGRAIVQALEAEGHRVIGIDRRDAEITADLATPDGRRRAIEAVTEGSDGRLDGLICCAGVGVTAPDNGLIVAVNVFAATTLLDALRPLLAAGQAPAATVIGSVAANQLLGQSLPLLDTLLDGDEGTAREQAAALEPALVYAASKCAVTRQVRRRAVAWGEAGIRLNVVAPGAVETPLHRAAQADPRYGQAVRDFVAPLGRAGTPAEIAALVAFLHSGGAGFLHGAVLHADGGMDAQQRPDGF